MATTVRIVSLRRRGFPMVAAVAADGTVAVAWSEAGARSALLSITKQRASTAQKGFTP